jgi:hypothetical protein
MTKTFNTAEEAKAIMYDINDQLGRLPYNPDLSKFCYNICDMVEELSKLEVYTRRTPPRSRYHVEYNTSSVKPSVLPSSSLKALSLWQG